MAQQAFGAEVYQRRMKRVAAAADEAGLAGLVITPGPDMAYLCGHTPPVTERLTALLLAAGARPVLVVPTLERGDAERSAAAAALRMLDWADGTDPYDLAAGLLTPGGRYGIADSAWSLHLLNLQAARPDSRYTAFTDALPMLRAVKDDAELERLAAAGAAADAAFEQIRSVRFAGRPERAIAAELARLLREHGHEQVDFTIVGSGPNGADPHHEAGDRVIEAGDAVVLDFGGLRDGYGSDTTRTVSVGPPSQAVREVFGVVRDAQQAAFAAVAPGVPCERIDAVARRVITDAGYGEYFIHRVGHGIGMTTHEPPYLVAGETQPLVPGMCFSIEPGVYLPGRFGVRIEDIVTVTDTGGRRFNTSTHDLQIVA